MDGNCTHLDNIREVTPSANGCEECLKMGDTWTDLRICLTCGYVGCCDESANKHAFKHFLATDHPVVQAYEPDEGWLWCYVDQVFFDETPVPVRINGITEPRRRWKLT